jgi:hypothetical protein
MPKPALAAKNRRKQPQAAESRRKQKCLHLLSFAFWNPDFSMGYGGFK